MAKPIKILSVDRVQIQYLIEFIFSIHFIRDESFQKKIKYSNGVPQIHSETESDSH
jgi:hypothetical protein